MICMDAISIIEARMSKIGGLDFETNFEWLFISMVVSAVHSRVEVFKALLDKHKLSMKKETNESFGVNVPLLRLIANGQIFNQSFLHPL